MLVSSIWCTLSPVSDASLGAATAGVPISAPRPLPKPERAMSVRLPKQTSQRKQQSSGQCATRSALRSSNSTHQPSGVSVSFSEKHLKKVLTLSPEIVYHVGSFQNRERTFAR